MKEIIIQDIIAFLNNIGLNATVEVLLLEMNNSPTNKLPHLESFVSKNKINLANFTNLSNLLNKFNTNYKNSQKKPKEMKDESEEFLEIKMKNLSSKKKVNINNEIGKDNLDVFEKTKNQGSKPDVWGRKKFKMKTDFGGGIEFEEGRRPGEENQLIPYFSNNSYLTSNRKVQTLYNRVQQTRKSLPFIDQSPSRR